jgi:DNA-binding GntR family transcriptional regulator
MEISRSTIAEQVFDYLRGAILDLTIEPGEHLNETRIAEQLAVSRTPVREAIRMLEAEGLALRQPNGRLTVVERSIEDMLDAFEARVPLESYAARLAARKITREQVTELERVYADIQTRASGKNRQELGRATDQFHAAVCRIGGNSRIVGYVQEINDHIRVYRASLFRSSLPIEDGEHSHRPILEALRVKDEDGAEDAMREHLLQSMEYLCSLWKGK